MRTSFLGGCLLALLAVDAAEALRHWRTKRYAIEGSFWGVRTVTYKFATPCSSLNTNQLIRVFEKAFKVWEERTGLKFEHKPNGDAHIDIVFASGSHGDGEPFDGRGRILAHAYFPRYGGDVHFDDDEIWSEDKNGPGLDLYAVAVHEIGHALGLKHSHERMAIMAPFYHTYTGERLHLHSDDLAGIDRLYGPSGAANRGRGVIHPSREEIPDICKNTHLDAITQISNGSIYAFQGSFVWDLSLKNCTHSVKRIKDAWGIEGPIGAAMTNSNGNVYIFKAKEYYVFDRNMNKIPGYPRKVSKGLIDTPDGVEAASSWHEDGKPYFFKRGKYWRYSRWGIMQEWPRRIAELFKATKAPLHQTSEITSLFQIPNKIDAAFYHRGIGVFLFSGERYWQISGKRRHIKYPRSVAEDWFQCNSV